MPDVKPGEKRADYMGRCMGDAKSRKPDLIQGGQNIARDLELGAAAVQPPVTLNLVEQWIRPGQHLSEAFPGPCPAVIEAHTMLNGSDLQRSHPRRPDARASTPSPPPSAHPRTNTGVSL